MNEPEAPDRNSPDRPRTGIANLMQQRPVAITLGFEAGLGVFALLLALVFGLEPWLSVRLSADALVHSLLGTVVMTAAMLVLIQMRWGWVQELERVVREFLLPLFRHAGPVSLGAISLMAGVGEELLFRGVIQAGLSGPLGPIAALLLASLLFALAHAVTIGYFGVTFLIGLYLGWLYQATGNLLVPILVHFFYDWLVLSWYRFGPGFRR